MTIAISSQMAASLVALTNTADDISMTQNRLATGLSVASASDNIAVYFKAKSYSEKADNLDTTNKGISQAVANLDTVDKALSNMQDNLRGALQLMRDAAAKAVTVQKAATVGGDATYATVTSNGRTVMGDIVQTKPSGTNAASKADSGSYFQVGDVFGIVLKDSSGTSVTKYFRATDTTKAVPSKAVNAAGDYVDASGATTANGAAITENTAAAANGSSYNQAINFNDLASLKDAIQSAFGYDTVTMNLKTGGTTNAPTYQLGFTLASVNQSFTFFQANDQAVNTGAKNADNTAATDPGAAFDFDALFGKLQNAANATYGTSSTPNSDKYTFNVGTTSTTVTGGTTFSAVGGAANNADVAIQARLDASNFFKQTLVGLDNLVRDAYLPGYANLLKGEQMTVNLNDTGDVKQVIKLTQKADPQSLGFSGYRIDGQGTVSTSTTADDFRTDANINSAISQSNTAIQLLKQVQTILSAAKVAMNSRLDYNKSMVTTLQQGAISMTAADSNAEAANLAALQNRQAFGVNNMTSTKQAEQSLIQLLR